MNAQLSRITKGALIMITWMCLSWPRDFLGLTTVPDAEAFTVTKTYTFDASLESYSATCGTNVTCARSTADGSPGTGSLEEALATKNNNKTWQWELSGITWESLGVPAGSIVTQVDGSYNHKSATFTSGATGAGDNTSGDLTIRDSAGTTVLATPETAVSYSGTAAWATQDASGAVSIPGSSQPSSTSIRIRLAGNIRTQNITGASVTLRQDQIVLTVTYFPAFDANLLAGD